MERKVRVIPDMDDPRANDERETGHDRQSDGDRGCYEQLENRSHSWEPEDNKVLRNLSDIGRVETLESGLASQIAPITAVLGVEFFTFVQNQSVDLF